MNEAVKRVVIRVDVDTHTGLRDGVPVLLDLFARCRIPASFFVTMGPDHSGRAIRRVFTRPGFARKMARTGALKTYGLYTVLSGTLLPARPVGFGSPHLLRLIEACGHECGIHGWDHVLWHDGLETMDRDAITRELRQACDAFAAATGHPPAGTVAPAWRATPLSLAVQDSMPFQYASDSRGTTPFRVAGPDGAHRLIQIPSTLPTLDEVIGLPGWTPESIVPRLAAALRPGGLNVLTIHTEVEGRHHASTLETLVRRLLSDGWSFETLGEAAAVAAAANPEVCALLRGDMPGRAGWLSVQGPAASTAQHR